MKKMLVSLLTAVMLVSTTLPAVPLQIVHAAETEKVLDMNFNNSDLTDAAGTVTATSELGTPKYVEGHDGGKAIDLNGSVLNLGTSTELQPDDITVSFWAKAPAGGYGASGLEERTFFWFKDVNGYNTDGWYLTSAEEMPLYFVVGTGVYGGGVQQTTMSLDEFFPEEEWVHVAITYDGTSHELSCYRNGTQIETTMIYGTACDIVGSSCNKYVGRQGYADANGLTGALDDIQIYSDVLSSAEIALLSGQEPENVALTATPAVSFFSNWQRGENVLNDGKLTYDTDGEKWGTWGNTNAAETASYTWEKPVLLTGTDLYIWDNEPDLEYDGIATPKSLVFEYLPEGSNEWTVLKTVEENIVGSKAGALNSVVFDTPVTATALRVTLNKNMAEGTTETYAGVGATEWVVYGFEMQVLVTKSDLQAAVDAVGELKEENYTPATWEAFEETLEAIKTVLADDTVISDEIKAAIDVLEYRQSELKEKADKAELLAVVSAVENYDSGKYTEETWATVAAELEEAKAVLADENVNQSAVNTAVRQLDEAVGQLEGRTAIVDKTALQAAVDAEEELLEFRLPYVDVVETDWFYESVSYNYIAKIMTGLDKTHFGPYDTLSRAQFALILYRIEGQPEVETDKKFHDITGDEWYGPAVLWAAEAGIVTGYLDGNYGPVDLITREQMAVMMYRYAKYLEKDVSKTGDLSKFKDTESVSPFATDAFAWANGMGIITGKENGTMLAPQANTARAEAAAIIERFINAYADMSKDTVALLDNYMPNAKAVFYDGMTVPTITVNVKDAGTLYIGTASVKDLIFARRYLMDYAVDGKVYEVTAGTNTIAVDLEVAAGETIVLGGNGSVGIHLAEDGSVYTSVSTEYQTGALYEEGKLDIQVEIDYDGKETRVFESFDTDIENFSVASSTAVYAGGAPYAYQNKTLFEDSVVTRIGIPVKTVSALNDDQVLTVSVIDAETMKNAYKVYKLNIPLEELGNSTTVNKYIYVDCQIPVEKGQTLAFGARTGDVVWGYYANMQNPTYTFHGNAGTAFASSDNVNGILFDVYITKGDTVEGQLTRLDNLEAAAIRANEIEELTAVVEDKNLSILADSISTYQGYNNNATTSNSTTGSNAVFYSSFNLANVNDTWWMQAINDTNMNLLVNNAWSGSCVYHTHSSAGYKTRPVNMHDDTGMNAGTQPDIITVFLGINDFDGGANLGTYSEDLYDTLITENADGTVTYKEPVNVTEAYIIMMDKMVRTYEGVDIFCFTLLPNSVRTDYAVLREYNTNICLIAEHYDATVVDLYYDSGITEDNFHNYMIDGLHPNAIGMDMITDTLLNAMRERYVG